MFIGRNKSCFGSIALILENYNIRIGLVFLSFLSHNKLQPFILVKLRKLWNMLSKILQILQRLKLTRYPLFRMIIALESYPSEIYPPKSFLQNSFLYASEVFWLLLGNLWGSFLVTWDATVRNRVKRVMKKAVSMTRIWAWIPWGVFKVTGRGGVPLVESDLWSDPCFFYSASIVLSTMGTYSS